jgi:hypothetical protein
VLVTGLPVLIIIAFLFCYFSGSSQSSMSFDSSDTAVVDQERTKEHDISRDDDDGAGTNAATFPSVFHKDTFLIFRALCKLSMKGLQDEGNSPSDPIALQNKYV